MCDTKEVEQKELVQMVYQGSLRKVSSEEERMREAKDSFKKLKGLMQTPTFETVGARMSRRLPETGSLLTAWLRDLSAEKKTEIGFGVQPDTPKAPALRPNRMTTRHNGRIQ